MKSSKLYLHPRNKNREPYDLVEMCNSLPLLSPYIIPNKRGEDSVDFSNPASVKVLNRAILNHYYGIKEWDFPDQNLCPAIPGRAEYIHRMADVLNESINNDNHQITCLDVGVGASCIYPIIGIVEYNWNFIASDIDLKSLKSAQGIMTSNPSLRGKIEFKHQSTPNSIFKGVITSKDKIDLTICNPPFHESVAAARKGNTRKVENLSSKRNKKPNLNFAGNNKELVCAGGEVQFIQRMIKESKELEESCTWFSSLVSKESNLSKLHKILEKKKPKDIRVIDIRTGNKKSRILAWTFKSLKKRASKKE